MHKTLHAVFAASSLALVACGGSSDVPHGSGSITGAPTHFSVLSAYENAPMKNGQPDLSEIELVMLDQNWSCGDLQNSASSGPPPHYLELVVRGPSALAAGNYTVQPIGTAFDGTNPLAEIGTFTNDSSDFSATDGTVSLTTVSASELKGSFNVTDGTSTVTGNFDGHFCSVPEAFQ